MHHLFLRIGGLLRLNRVEDLRTKAAILDAVEGIREGAKNYDRLHSGCAIEATEVAVDFLLEELDLEDPWEPEEQPMVAEFEASGGIRELELD